jgi:putative ABC transport system permease protein
MVRLEGPNESTVKAKLDSSVLKFIQGKSFESFYMEELIEQNYMGETKTGQFLSIFTSFAILIGCSGLYALSAYEGEQRIKELGIRKIMGASALQLLLILSRSFLKLVILSLFIGMPLAYFLANIWLRAFPYKIPWSAGIFIQASVGVLLLGWITIIWQAIKASRLNPVEALRYQ